MFDDELNPWRLHALVQGLSPDSAVARSVNEHWHWGVEHELLAQLVELTHALWRAQLKNPPAPLRIPRPDDPDRKKNKRITAAERFALATGRSSDGN